MPRYKSRVSLRCYVDVTVDADDEDSARDAAITDALETMYPEASDVEVDWIEEVAEDVRV